METHVNGEIDVGKRKKQIRIIGAGISGLVACKHALEQGFNPIIFESSNCIGGVWSNTIESTKLQTPKDFYQFSDFTWPKSVTETFPNHNQVKDYIESYALHFNILKHIQFNAKVVSIDYCCEDDGEEMAAGCDNLWGGTGRAFSPKRKWVVTVLDLLHPMDPYKVYEVDFVILCIGKFSSLPNIPHFPMNKGPEVFDGEVIHSMEYAEMGSIHATKLVKDKRVAVIGFQKSAIDLAAEVARLNGVKHPCTLLLRRVHWTVPEGFLKLSFQNLNRFSELMIHKPREGFFLWFLAILLSPLLCIFSKFVESYLKWIYPLKKYNMIPDHGFLRQISSCMFTVLPADFYRMVEEGSLILKKSKSYCFCKKGLIIDEEENFPLKTDIVIFATGYRSDDKLCNIFTSTYFQKCITGSSSPFYRECIHPRIPQLAILGYSESPAILYTTEMQSKWLAHFLAGKFKLPTIAEMEEDVLRWEKCMQRYACKYYKRACVSVLLQIYCNDLQCGDMNLNPRRKKKMLSELFAPYKPSDYQRSV
ncbi:probable flavin-containing monooxygenase 1 [Nicotiana tomentosiformis]|uniref:probable flavin-containing monooxygenase 1 n=1 Tax=Nicotiana tomentosiformis TaxID=4098 RepID=UPI00051B976F|nr:probable flavin-containing monooxygenase 1 [Nicotiana tomentosiformis]